MTKSTNIFRQKQRELSNAEKEKIAKIKDKADEIFELLKVENKSEEEVCFKEARVRLQEAVFWATKAISS